MGDMNRNISQNRIAILAVSQYVKNRNNIEIVAQISQYYKTQDTRNTAISSEARGGRTQRGGVCVCVCVCVCGGVWEEERGGGRDNGGRGVWRCYGSQRSKSGGVKKKYRK